jgi:hypothetical protein
VIDIALRRSGQRSLRLDLDGVAGEHEAASLLARELARAVMGRQTLSLLAAPSLAPAAARRERIAFAEQVGARVAALAVEDEPVDGVSVTEVLDAVAKVYEQAAAPAVLWIDHLQAPALTSRHPLDVDALLWNVRSLHQRIELPIILSGSKAVTQIAYGRHGAFYGDGVWVTLTRPGLDAWHEVAAALPDGGPPPRWVSEMADITHRHPATMLLALAVSDEIPDHARTPLDLWQLLLALDDGLVGRALQHARSLHRLGGLVLQRIADGVGPYEGARTKAEQNDRSRATRRLYEGGLITQPRKRAWEVTNPLLAGRLRRDLPLTPADAMPVEAPSAAPG